LDTAWPATLSGFRIAYHPRVGSTQDEARRRMETGAREFVVVAGEQTGGHGRLGRSWASPPGNLYASVVTVLRFPREFLPAGSLIAANALCTALAGLAPASPPPLAVKWPNDVLLDGRKVAGLLLEVSGDVVVVGCGVNLKAVPSDLVQATTLAVHGFDADAPRVLERWLDAWNVAVSALAEGDTGGWRDAWLARAAGLHRPIRVTLADRRLEGIHRGIDAHGALRVETAGGLETVLAGDVELVRLGETF
jgi:BirA family biotin operon repressor/biotin-[acetyl-CoA-carboxylase] ligase